MNTFFDTENLKLLLVAKSQFASCSQEWCDNGVFVFRKGKEVNICLKLPIRVEMEGSKMNILDGDLASVSADNKRRRQNVAMQVRLLVHSFPFPYGLRQFQTRSDDLSNLLLLSMMRPIHASLQAVKLLTNPKTEVLTVQRSQLLTLILLNKLLVAHGFKDAADAFKVGPDDRVVLRSSQVCENAKGHSLWLLLNYLQY